MKTPHRKKSRAGHPALSPNIDFSSQPHLDQVRDLKQSLDDQILQAQYPTKDWDAETWVQSIVSASTQTQLEPGLPPAWNLKFSDRIVADPTLDPTIPSSCEEREGRALTNKFLIKLGAFKSPPIRLKNNIVENHWVAVLKAHWSHASLEVLEAGAMFINDLEAGASTERTAHDLRTVSYDGIVRMRIQDGNATRTLVTVSDSSAAASGLYFENMADIEWWFKECHKADQQRQEAQYSNVRRTCNYWTVEGNKIQPSRTLERSVKSADWDALILDSGVKTDLLKRTEDVIDPTLSTIFTRLGVARKAGYLVHGPPGNGKTSFPRALANKLNLSVVYCSTQSAVFDNIDGSSLISQVYDLAANNTPCIVVLEEIDGLLTPETRSQLLACLDGLTSYPGIITIATTNNVDLLDTAFTSRPGRFDRILRFDPPTLELRVEYFTHKLCTVFALETLTDEMKYGVELASQLMAGMPFSALQDAMLTALGELGRNMSNPVGRTLVEAAHRVSTQLLTAAAEVEERRLQRFAEELGVMDLPVGDTAGTNARAADPNYDHLLGEEEGDENGEGEQSTPRLEDDTPPFIHVHIEDKRPT